MTDDVVKFPDRANAKPPDLLIGPFEEWRVVVQGRCIPHLTGRREPDGIWLTVDHRLAAGPFTEEAAYQAASLAANAMAVATGYSHAGAESKDQPFAPRVNQLDGLPA